MILGHYPCCDGPLSLAVTARTPAYIPQLCPHCGAKVWHIISRLDPMSYCEKDFLALYDVDFDAGTVTPKKP